MVENPISIDQPPSLLNSAVGCSGLQANLAMGRPIASTMLNIVMMLIYGRMVPDAGQP